MINKKIILLTLLVGLLAISSVNAGDVTNETNDLVSIENNDQSVNEIADGEQTLEIASANDDSQVIKSSGDVKTFNDLKKKVYGLSNNGKLDLSDDYKYNGAGNFSGITISKNNVTINGNGHTIDANAGGRIFEITGNNVTIKNLIFINSFVIYGNLNGGAIYNTGDGVSVVNSTFVNNTIGFGNVAGFGGAIANYGSITVSNSTFVDNSANNWAGAIFNQVSLSMYNCTFINNSANIGGAVCNYGSISIDDSSFVNNSGISGGAIANYKSLNVGNSNFVNNVAINGSTMYTGRYGNTVANDNWWGDNNPNWKTLLYNTNTPSSYVVLKLITNNSVVYLNFYRNGTSTIVNIPPRDVKLAIDGNVLSTSKIVNGAFNLSYSEPGDVYIVTAEVDNQVFSISFNNGTISSVNLVSEDVAMLFKDGSRFVAVLTDVQGNPLFNQSLVFTINGNSYTRNTDKNGTASIALNLVAGTYKANVYFKGDSVFNSVSKNITVDIKSTIDGSNLVKMYQNDTQFYAVFIDSNGKALANKSVTFNINGVFYNRTADSNGKVKLSINLRPGNYVLTAYNLVNGEEKGFNVLVKSLIEASDLTKYYRNASKFESKIYNKDGSLAINKDVKFNINGVFYTRTTDSNGVVSLAINLRPGEYDITTIYDGLEIGNKVNVLSTLETNDLSMNYQDGSKFSVKTLNGQGNALSNQNITFNVNGVFYHRTTGDDGVANLNINLMKGKYIITSIWNSYEVANEIKIS